MAYKHTLGLGQMHYNNAFSTNVEAVSDMKVSLSMSRGS